MISARTFRNAALGLVLAGGVLAAGAGVSNAEPVSTTPPTTVAPTPTTVVSRDRDRTPATLEATCALSGAAVSCSWTASTNSGIVRLLVLRGDGKVGRAFGPYAPVAGSMVDGTVKSGVTYSFVVVGLDASNKSIAHSAGSFIPVP